MKFKLILKLTIILVSLGLFVKCTDNPIPYDLSDSDIVIDTLTINSITGATYSSPPLMGSTNGLYFGSQDGNNNKFSLIEISQLSISNSVRTYSLLDTSATVDSLVFNFTALDSTILTGSQFELSYFPESGDSVFSESESNYTNITEAVVANSIAAGFGVFTQAAPDSNEVVYPILSIKVNDIEGVLDFIADTTDNQNRTFMLKNIMPIDHIVNIRSRESADYPVLHAYYRVDDDTLHSIFYSKQDITIVEPRTITEKDKNSISISRAAGLKSIIEIDFTELPIDSTTKVIKSAELIINNDSDYSLDDFEIKAAVLENSINIDGYWEVGEDEYSVEGDVLLSGNIENDVAKIELREYFQGIITGSYDPNGLKLFASSDNDPFKTINFILDKNDNSNNPYIKVTYVKL